MATVEEVVRDLLASVDSNIGAPRLAKAVSNRYVQLVNQVKFRHLRKLGELSLTGLISDGTVTVTRGSTTVTGVDTTFSTDITNTATLYYFRGATAWYQIASVTTELALELTTAFTEEDVDEGSYHIVQRHYPLNTSARWLGSVVHSRLRRPLDVISSDELDLIAPGRALPSSYPQYICQHSFDATNGWMVVELYPTPTDSEIINYVYWELPTELAYTATIPELIDAYVLKEGAYIDLCRYEASRAVRLGSVEAAGYWRNESRAQETKWKKYIQDAVRTGRGSDDVSFILKTARSWKSSSGGEEERTAHDVVYNRTWSA